jgi:hypothetical protein
MCCIGITKRREYRKKLIDKDTIDATTQFPTLNTVMYYDDNFKHYDNPVYSGDESVYTFNPNDSIYNQNYTNNYNNY